MTLENRSVFSGIEPRLLSSLNPPEFDLPKEDVPREPPIFRIEKRVAALRSRRPEAAAAGEDSRPARLVEFHGGCYAFLTEWTNLHVLNDLLDAVHGETARLRSVSPSQLEPGDFVLFRRAAARSS